LRAAQRLGAIEQRGAAHRKQLVGHQPLRPHARPVAAAVADRGIDVAALEVDQAGRCGDAHVDAGVSLLKGGEARQQPFGGVRGKRRDGEDVVLVLAQQPVGRKPQVVEGRAHARQIVLCLRSERECSVLADEQTKPELLLQPLDLVADRGLGDVQLGCGKREAQMPRGGLEGPQPVERWQPRGHLTNPKFMSFCHLKRDKVSFVEGAGWEDISARSLALGADHVYLHPANDDKSSCSGNLGEPRRDPSRLAGALSQPRRAAPLVRSRSARCRHILERHRSRSRKAVLAGLNAVGPALPREGCWPAAFSERRELTMTSLRFDDLAQFSDTLHARSGEAVTVRFVEPRDAEELQNYYRSLSTRSRYNRFHGAMSELPKSVLD